MWHFDWSKKLNQWWGLRLNGINILQVVRIWKLMAHLFCFRSYTFQINNIQTNCGFEAAASIQHFAKSTV